MMLTKKVNDNRLSEKEYRSLKERISYSGLKTFVNSRRKFFKEFIEGQKSEEEPSASLILGQLTHCMLAGEEIDDKFHIASAQIPVGQMLELANALYIRSLKTLNKEGVQTDSFETLFTDAFNKVKFDFNNVEIAFKGKSLEKVLEMFTNPDKNGCIAELYYREKISCIGKTVVSVNVIRQAELIVDKVKNHEFTSRIANIQNGEGIEVFEELAILFEIEGVPYKALVDKLIVDHENKIIWPYDWKTGWDTASGEAVSYNFMKQKYWIQTAMYDVALRYWKKEHDLHDYIIKPMQFIFIDSANFEDPCILQLSDGDITLFKDGFVINGKFHKGLFDIMSEIQWHITTGIWSRSMENDENKGIHKLDLRYE